jgi:transcriptional regulator with XRE-family HTH domain
MFAINLCLTYPVPLLAMKQTPEDLRFAGDFAEALRPQVAEEKKNGRSLRQIADRLGVTEPALKKYLSGRTTPCLRTVVLAYTRYGLSVPYSGVSFAGSVASKPKRGLKRSSPLQQLFLPFEIQTPSPKDRVRLKLLPIGVRRYQLQVTLRLAR